jgi:predicted aspartyl protease
MPVVTVLLNGRSTRLLFDTGASATSIRPAFAEQLGIPVAPSSGDTFVGVGGSQQGKWAGPVELRFGQERVTTGHVPVLVAADQDQAGVPPGEFGADILSKYEVDIDLPHRRVRLYKGSPCGADLPGWLPNPSVMPMRRFGESPLAFVGVSLDGADAYGLIDTGARSTLINATLAARAGVAPDVLANEMKAEISGIGTARPEGHLYRFRRLRVGNDVLDAPDLMVADAMRRIEMLVGEDILSTRKIWLSYSTNRVFIASRW